MSSSNLGRFFSDQARRTPDRVALIDLAVGGRTVDYATLDARTERLAAALQQIGLRPGDRVALQIGNRTEYLEAFFGSMRSGAIPVLINPRLSDEVRRFIAEDSGAVALIVDAAERPGVSPWMNVFGGDRRIALGAGVEGWQDYETLLAAAPAAAEPVEPEPGAIAFQPYTAGSTGRPKGVLLTHDGMLWSIAQNQRYWPARPEERALVAVPMVHKNAMRGIVKPMLNVGGSFVLQQDFEPRRFLQALAEYRCTFVSGVPAIFTLALQQEDLLDSLDFSALERIYVGSAMVSDALLAELGRRWPRTKVVEAYGLTEGGGPIRSPIDGSPMKRGSCGVAAPETGVRLVGEEGKDDARQGELWVRSPAVLRGYHNRPDLDAERLVDGWLRTGDIFRRDDDGHLFFVGRVDDMFSCGGENIYPREVESVLLQHPAVRDAVVVPIPHPVKTYVPAAMVLLKTGHQSSEEELRRFALSTGPAFAHPRKIAVVDALPLNSAGKPDRGAVRRHFDTQGD